jgi:hypothetical protein
MDRRKERYANITYQERSSDTAYHTHQAKLTGMTRKLQKFIKQTCILYNFGSEILA